MKNFTPLEHFNSTELPNMFDYATKELSQDAFLCWVLAWKNTSGNKMCEVAAKFFAVFINKSVYKDTLSVSDIVKVEIIPQHKNIDILVLAHLKSGKILPFIIEDKTNTTEHDEQLKKYRDKIINEYIDYTEPICIYYKTGYIQENKSKIEDQHYILFDKKEILDVLYKFKRYEMPLVFCEYYTHIVSKQMIEDAFISAIENNSVEGINDYLHLSGCQWELMKKLTTNIKGCPGINPMIQKANRGGTYWTHFEIDNVDLKGYDYAFYRIDLKVKGYYFSLRQYLKYNKKEYMDKVGIYDEEKLRKGKMQRLEIYRQCFEKAVREKDDKVTIFHDDGGLIESEIGTFYLKDVETLLFLKNNIAAVTKRFLELVRYQGDGS